jgi:hypothetical protein
LSGPNQVVVVGKTTLHPDESSDELREFRELFLVPSEKIDLQTVHDPHPLRGPTRNVKRSG